MDIPLQMAREIEHPGVYTALDQVYGTTDFTTSWPDLNLSNHLPEDVLPSSGCRFWRQDCS
jgi:hypothetical protein